MTVLDRALVQALPLLPRRTLRAFASPYIAGDTVDEACAAVARLNAGGKAATVDVLGEEVGTAVEARRLTAVYLDVLDEIGRRGLDANISLKPTALGLDLGGTICRGHVEALVRRAEQDDGFVRIDMEDSTRTDATLRLYRELRERGCSRVGIVLQARLRRTLDDIASLAALQPSVRLCKGIYLEPERLAHTRADEIRGAFMRCAEALVDVGATVAFATHDDELVERALRLVERRGLAREQYEFQLLFGVRGRLADALARDGHRVRVYVPFGDRWYEYSLRRLRENPRFAASIAVDTVRRVAGRTRS